MVRVVLSGPLKMAAGVGEVDTEAKDIRGLLTQLGEEYPALKQFIDKGVAVSIDGQIYRDAWFEQIPAGAEVHVLMPLAGG